MPRVSCWLGFVAHVLIFFAYVWFFYYVELAVGLRILGGAGKRQQSALADIQRECSGGNMVAERAGGMDENGFFELRNGLWCFTGEGKPFERRGRSTFLAASFDRGPGNRELLSGKEL